MLLRLPNFYDKFTCIANRCTDNCCIGWEIDVDEDTLDYYKSIACDRKCDSVKKAYLQKFLESIEDGHIKLTKDDRCPFLMENGLCDTICHLGANGTDCDENGRNVLGNICREHPRFVEVYGDIMEKGLGLCCEETVRLLLEEPVGEKSLKFVERDVDDEPDALPEGVAEARDAIFAEREHIFDLLTKRSKSLKERLIDVLGYAVETSGIDFDEAEDSSCEESADDGESESLSDSAIRQTWIEILGEGESYGPAWDKAFEGMVREGWTVEESLATSPMFSDEEGEKIIAYLIFRYYAKSLFDGDSLTKVQFAIFFWIILQRFGHILGECGSVSPKINAVKLLSKQTEYSEEIMEILANNFFQNPAFSVEQFRQIILEL